MEANVNVTTLKGTGRKEEEEEEKEKTTKAILIFGPQRKTTVYALNSRCRPESLGGRHEVQHGFLFNHQFLSRFSSF